MVTLRERFRIRLEAAFKKRGDQADFLRASSLSMVTVHRWLKNQRVPDLDQVEQVASALGCDPIELISDVEDRPWALVPKHLLTALAQVHPDHYPIVLNFLESFTVEREASKLSKGLEKPAQPHKKRRQ